MDRQAKWSHLRIISEPRLRHKSTRFQTASLLLEAGSLTKIFLSAILHAALIAGEDGAHTNHAQAQEALHIYAHHFLPTRIPVESPIKTAHSSMNPLMLPVHVTKPIQEQVIRLLMLTIMHLHMQVLQEKSSDALRRINDRPSRQKTAGIHKE
jgi:hypothetical protein